MHLPKCWILIAVLALQATYVYAKDQVVDKPEIPAVSHDEQKKQPKEELELKQKAEAYREWVERTVNRMQTACRATNTVTLDLKGSYQYSTEGSEPLIYSLFLAFQAPNKIHADLTELFGEKRVRREIVSDGSTLWYYREATNELSQVDASKDREEFLSQLQAMLPGDIGFVLRGLRGDWHWFRGMQLENDGKEEIDGKKYIKLRAKLSPTSKLDADTDKPLERYEFSMNEKTSLPKNMVVSYTYNSLNLKFRGNFDVDFDFDATPSEKLFKKPPPDGAKFVY